VDIPGVNKTFCLWKAQRKTKLPVCGEPRGNQNIRSVEIPEENIKHPDCGGPTGKQNFL